MISTNDSLNNLTTEDNELIQKQIREYFEEMELPEEEIEKRIGFATDIEKAFRNLFILMLGADMLGNDISSKSSDYADYVYRRVQDKMVEYDYSKQSGYEAYGYVEQYEKQRCKEIVDTTILHRADSFYLSTAHSIAIAEDETNAIANYDMEQRAIAQGYTMKTWVTMRDKKVRHTHELCDGKTINIFKAFDVGNYQMMFPCDHSLGASMKEIANCRCVIEYSGKNKKVNILDKKQLNYDVKQVKIESNNQIPQFNLQFFASKDKQYGKKFGKHAYEFGLDPSVKSDREKLMSIVENITTNYTEKKIGNWSGRTEEVYIYIKGSDVVVTELNGDFITVMKNAKSSWIENARTIEVR